MRGQVDHRVSYPAADMGEMEDFLHAAEELELLLEAEPGVLVRQLTQMLKRQSEFRRLRDRFGIEVG